MLVSFMIPPLLNGFDNNIPLSYAWMIPIRICKKMEKVVQYLLCSTCLIRYGIWPSSRAQRKLYVLKCICGLPSPFHQFGLLVALASA